MPTQREVFKALASSPYLLRKSMFSDSTLGKMPDPVSDLNSVGANSLGLRALYKKIVDFPEVEPGKKVWLDLGQVKYIATVTVNGKEVGVLWTNPWRIDISSAIKPGENSVEIAVANVWANGLIDDEQEPADITWQMGDPILKGGYFMKEFPQWFLKDEPRPSKKHYTFTTWNYFHNPDATLAPSGMLGPVSIMVSS